MIQLLCACWAVVQLFIFLASRKRSSSTSRSNTRKSIYLWEFLFGLLEDDECTSVITWTNKSEGIFELKNTDELAKLWGTVKNRPKMDKNKLIRAIRTYYERGMLKKVRCLWYSGEVWLKEPIFSCVFDCTTYTAIVNLRHCSKYRSFLISIIFSVNGISVPLMPWINTYQTFLIFSIWQWNKYCYLLSSGSLQRRLQ